jgi:hypothetical protein
MLTRLRRLGPLLEAAREVRTRTGKSLRTQAGEILGLRRGPGRLGATQYFAFGLYDPARYDAGQRAEFVAWDWDEVGGRLNVLSAAAICDDKLVTDAVLRGFGLRVPEVVAVYHPPGRLHGTVPTFRTPAEMAGFLRNGAPYPLFGKPVRDRQGAGASSLSGYDAATDRVLHPGDKSTPLDQYVREVPATFYAGFRDRDEAAPAGYFFQRRITPHPDIVRMTGGRGCCLRLLVLLFPDGPRLHRAVLKMAVGENIVDHGTPGYGNLVSLVDRATGHTVLTFRVRGREGHGPSLFTRFGVPAEVHPDTGVRVLGMPVPLWDEAVALVLRAAAMLPQVRFQSWDLLLGPDGPVLLELNRRGGLQQLPGGPGFNDAEYRDFLAAWGRAAGEPRGPGDG